MAELTHDQMFNVGAADVWNCANAFEFVCPRNWESLTATDDPAVRFCSVCQQSVHRCTTPTEFVGQAELGRCVAIPEGYTPISVGTELVGRPSQQALREHADHKRAVRQWWGEVIGMDPQFASEAFAALRRVFRPA